MKKFLAMLLSLSMVFALSACGQKAESKEEATEEVTEEAAEEAAPEEASESETLTFGVSLQSLENPYFVNCMKGMQQYGEEHGHEITFCDANYDTAQQVTDIENFIQMGVDGIVITPIDENAVMDVVDKAKEAGIVVVALAQPISNANGQYTNDQYEYGQMIGTAAADFINSKLSDQEKVEVIVISQDNVEACIARGDAIVDTITEKCPNAVIAARQAGDTTPAAMEVAESCLTAYPDAKIIAAVNDSAALGAVEAAVGLGLADDTFGVFGADATNEGLAKMKEEGSIFRATVDVLPAEGAAYALSMCEDMIINGCPDTIRDELMSQEIITQDSLK